MTRSYIGRSNVHLKCGERTTIHKSVVGSMANHINAMMVEAQRMAMEME
jgi:hypothetical protein